MSRDPEILRRAASEIRAQSIIPEDSRAFDFIDYPTAWAIQRAGVAHADPQCSAEQTGGAVLCDCGALSPRWRELRALLAVADALDQDAAILDESHDGPLEMAMRAIAEPLVTVARTFLGEPA